MSGNITITISKQFQPITIARGSTIVVNSGDISSTRVSYIAGEDLNPFDVVIIRDGLVFKADVTDPSHASSIEGVTTESAVSGSSVSIATNGRVSNNLWNFDSNLLVFLGLTPGSIVQDDEEPGGTARFSVQIGRVINPTTINIDIDNIIIY